MSRAIEISANLFNALSIVLAARNHVSTWWTGIVGCVLFGYFFLEARLYADVSLQIFFIITSFAGWWNWRPGAEKAELPIRTTQWLWLCGLTGLAILTTAAYGLLLYKFTNAASPFLDSAILAFSVLGQFLLMGRRIENWWSWLVVNSIAVPLYYSRGLYVTSALYAFFWANTIFALVKWRRGLRRSL